MTNTTCTVVTDARGGRCGEPAVATFTGRTGETFAECAAHLAETMPPKPIEVGDTVTVDHIGIAKVGTVVAIRGNAVDVEVPIAGGRRTKVITRRYGTIR